MLEKIKAERTKAMKEKNKTRLSTIRMILSTFETERGKIGRDLTEQELLNLVNRNRNNLLEEIKSIEAAGRDASAQKEQLEVVLEFLPKQLTQEEVDQKIAFAISNTSNMGEAMKLLTPELKGKADMKYVSGKVKEAFK